jgi:hypothetical protein
LGFLVFLGFLGGFFLPTLPLFNLTYTNGF